MTMCLFLSVVIAWKLYGTWCNDIENRPTLLAFWDGEQPISAIPGFGVAFVLNQNMILYKQMHGMLLICGMTDDKLSFIHNDATYDMLPLGKILTIKVHYTRKKRHVITI